MANRKDPTTELAYDKFRNGGGSYATEAVTPIAPKPINKQDSTIMEKMETIPLKKIINPKGAAFDFVGMLRSDEQDKVYDRMGKIFSSDMSFKGLNILKKAEKRAEIFQACVDLDASTRSKINIGVHIKDYNLLALLAALACEGLTNLFDSAIAAFPEDIRDIDLANASADIFRVIDGDHSTQALFDLGQSSIAPLVKSTGLIDTKAISVIYDRGTHATVGGLLDGISGAITNLTGGGTESNDISYVGNGRYKKDVSAHVASKPNDGVLSRVVGDKLDIFDLTSMF